MFGKSVFAHEGKWLHKHTVQLELTKYMLLHEITNKSTGGQSYNAIHAGTKSKGTNNHFRLFHNWRSHTNSHMALGGNG